MYYTSLLAHIIITMIFGCICLSISCVYLCICYVEKSLVEGCSNRLIVKRHFLKFRCLLDTLFK